MLCTGTCTAKRFHVDKEEQTCRIGCIGEPDCHYNRCPLLSRSLSQSGGTPVSNFENINYSTTSSLKHHKEAFKMGSWLWVLLTLLCTPTTITVTTRTIQRISRTAEENPPFDGEHAKRRPCVPVPMPSWAPV